MASSEREEP
jgi:hypothetical protein